MIVCGPVGVSQMEEEWLRRNKTHIWTLPRNDVLDRFSHLAKDQCRFFEEEGYELGEHSDRSGTFGRASGEGGEGGEGEGTKNVGIGEPAKAVIS